MATATASTIERGHAPQATTPGRSAKFSYFDFLRRRHLRPHKIYLRRDVGMAVFLNPKTGTQTFRATLLEGLSRIDAEPRVGSYYPIKPHRRYVMAPITDYLHFMRNTGQYRCYAFVRNPYSRFLSAWKNKFGQCHNGQPHKRTTRMLLPALRRFAARHNLPGAEADSLMPFETFLSWVEAQPEGRRDHHWDTQRAVLHLDVIKYHRLFRMEGEYAQGLMEVLTQAGIPADVIERKARRKKNATPPLTKPVYNAELAQRVYRLYECDFQALGYHEDTWQDLL